MVVKTLVYRTIMRGQLTTRPLYNRSAMQSPWYDIINGSYLLFLTSIQFSFQPGAVAMFSRRGKRKSHCYYNNRLLSSVISGNLCFCYCSSKYLDSSLHLDGVSSSTSSPLHCLSLLCGEQVPLVIYLCNTPLPPLSVPGWPTVLGCRGQ